MNVFTAKNPIVLGRQYENELVIIQFPIRRWRELYGDGVATLRNKRPTEPDDLAYEVVIEQTDDYVLWTITDTELLYNGCGKAQLTWRVNSHVAKSEIFDTVVKSSLPESADPPPPFQSYVERVELAAQEAVDAKDAAQAAAATLTRISEAQIDALFEEGE